MRVVGHFSILSHILVVANVTSRAVEHERGNCRIQPSSTLSIHCRFLYLTIVPRPSSPTLFLFYHTLAYLKTTQPFYKVVIPPP
jgi:hypothetical protein